jgi:hypothetical protein
LMKFGLAPIIDAIFIFTTFLTTDHTDFYLTLPLKSSNISFVV